jgi:hypothetical protein
MKIRKSENNRNNFLTNRGVNKLLVVVEANCTGGQQGRASGLVAAGATLRSRSLKAQPGGKC